MIRSDSGPGVCDSEIGEAVEVAAAKILVDTATDTIVGAHMLGPEYGELINFRALAIKLDLTTRQLKSMTAAYPPSPPTSARCSNLRRSAPSSASARQARRHLKEAT